jgi:hypothetical protein
MPEGVPAKCSHQQAIAAYTHTHSGKQLLEIASEYLKKDGPERVCQLVTSTQRLTSLTWFVAGTGFHWSSSTRLYRGMFPVSR